MSTIDKNISKPYMSKQWLLNYRYIYPKGDFTVKFSKTQKLIKVSRPSINNHIVNIAFWRLSDRPLNQFFNL